MASSQGQNPLEGHPKYEMVKKLNSGTFGFVQCARNKFTGELVAIKFLERGDKISKYVLREVKNHMDLLHPHIVQFKEVFLTDKHLAIAMEYAEGGDMFEYVVKRQGLSEDLSRWFFQQLIVAIDYCHKLHVVSRDIKLENTLLDKSPMPLVKLCDFGYSKNEDTMSAAKSKVGTPGYIAPEVIQRPEYDGKAADVWSCGVMLYVMLVGAYPFERPEDKDDPQRMEKLLRRIINVDYQIPKRVEVSAQCRDLLQKILVADPAHRITLQGIMDHPWFMTGLPDGVLQMNQQYFQPQSEQSFEQIQKLIEEAMKKPAHDTVDEYDDDTPASYFKTK